MTRVRRRKEPNAHSKTPERDTQYCNTPNLEIYLQRAPCAVPFRRSGETVEQISPEDELYFEVGVENYKGPAIIVASCVNAEEKLCPAPHQFLLEGHNCRDGIWLLEIMDGQKIKATIANVFIRQVNKDGFDHTLLPSSYANENAVRLEFKVELKDGTVSGRRKSLESVFSELIYDKRYFTVDYTEGIIQNCLPRIEIIEQPVSEVRYRYLSERSSGGSIPGRNSTTEKKTFPAVRILGYEGLAKIEVSCVTKDAPYRIHPHSLISRKKKNCILDGLCSVEIGEAENMIATFENLGIISIKRDDFEEALNARRRALTINPFEHNEGNGGERQLSSVRLCFQAFLKSPGQENFNMILRPVISEPINDIKRLNEPLNIFKVSHRKGSARGRQEMIILCNKVVKEEIEIIFFEEGDGWIKTVDKFSVHRQIALIFRIPAYKTIDSSVTVYIKLKRNDECSLPVPFTYEPINTGNSSLCTSKSSSSPSRPVKIPRKLPIIGNHRGIVPLPVLPESPNRSVFNGPQDVVMGNGGIDDSSRKYAEPLGTVAKKLKDDSCKTDEILNEVWKHTIEMVPALEGAMAEMMPFSDDSSSLNGIVNRAADNYLLNHDRPTYTQLQNVQPFNY